MALLRAGGIELLEDGVRPPDADNPLGYHEYEPVKRLPRDTGWLEAAEGRAVKVIHALLPALPEGPRYRVVLMRRELRDVVASQDRMLARLGTGRGRLGADRLATLLAAQIEGARAWLRARPQVAWMELDYDTLLKDPAPALAELAEFIASKVPPATLAAVVRPDLRHRGAPRAEAAGSAALAADPSKNASSPNEARAIRCRRPR